MKLLSNAIKIASVILGLAAPMTSAFADQGSIPPGQLPALTAEWWQWALSIPASVNPLTDPTGDFCMVGQRGPIWFLAGNSTGAPMITRNCSVPEGATLFFPVINTVDVNDPQCGDQNETAKEIQAEIQPFLNGIHSVSAQVDGKDVKKTLLRFVIPDAFEVAQPSDNLFGCPSDIYSPVVDGGYYVSLPPLALGTHKIYFHGESDYFDKMGKPQHFVQDVMYTLTVVPVSLK